MIQLNKIYNEDCLKFTERLQEQFIDVVLTSPPYNITENLKALTAKILIDVFLPGFGNNFLN